MSGGLFYLPDWDVPEVLMFYSRGRGEPGYRDLSNFGAARLILPLRFDPSVLFTYEETETPFQDGKSPDLATHEFICQLDLEPRKRTAAEAKRRGGNRAKVKPPADWDRISPLWMLYLQRAKYQLPRYRQLLLSTGDRVLVENSPSDARWGGWDRRRGRYCGQNLLGRALMRVRAEIRGELEPVQLPFGPLPAQDA